MLGARRHIARAQHHQQARRLAEAQAGVLVGGHRVGRGLAGGPQPQGDQRQLTAVGER